MRQFKLKKADPTLPSLFPSLPKTEFPLLPSSSLGLPPKPPQIRPFPPPNPPKNTTSILSSQFSSNPYHFLRVSSTISPDPPKPSFQQPHENRRSDRSNSDPTSPPTFSRSSPLYLVLISPIGNFPISLNLNGSKMNLRNRGKQPATKPTKRSRNESSSTPEPSINVELGNTYLFRDDDAYQMFLRFESRGISNCYHFDPKRKIPNRYLTKINSWINHFSLQELATTTDTYSAHTTRLFYANLRFNNTDNATSYFQGREIDVSFRKLSELLSMNIGTERIYIHKSWPWHDEHEKCQETPTDYRKWFGYGQRKDFYITDIPALHRVAHLLVNNILTPKSQLKTNIETGGLFYMRHMIAMDDLNLNIPYILVSHMHKAYANSRDTLPYGNLIHRILKDQGIEDPLFGVPKDEHKRPKNILDYFSGWVKTTNDMLVPPSDDRRNGYLMTPGAAPNQYYPLGEEPPAPEPEPEPVPVQEPTTHAASSSQTGNIDLVSLITSKFQNMGDQFNEFRTEFGTLNTTLTGYGQAIQTHDQHYTDFRKTLDGYGQQLTTFGTQLEGYGTQLTNLRNDMESGFADIQDEVKKCHTTVHKFWSESRRPGPSQGGNESDNDE